MVIKEKYNVNEYLGTYQSLLHKVMFTQMNSTNGIKLFRERAITDMFKEYKHLDYGPIPGKPVVTPFNLDRLTPLDKKKTLESVNLIRRNIVKRPK